jgi:cytoskeletal protein CcmA (bactofilin family)
MQLSEFIADHSEKLELAKKQLEVLRENYTPRLQRHSRLSLRHPPLHAVWQEHGAAVKNPFKQTGFDTIISQGTKLTGTLVLEVGSTAIVNGEIDGVEIKVKDPANQAPTTLMIGAGGVVYLDRDVTVNVVTVVGELSCYELTVDGTLSIKAGAVITAERILYRHLNIESGAVVLAKMHHLDRLANVAA